MIKKIWDNFIKAGLDSENASIELTIQIRSINFYNLLGVIMLVLHGIFNTIHHNSILGLIEFCLAFLLILNIIYLRISKNIKISSIILLISSIILISILFITGGINNTGIFWIFFFPIMAFFLFKIKKGFYWIMVYLFVFLIILILDFMALLTIPYSYITLRQAFFSFITISLFAYIYEDRKEKNEKIIKMQINIDPLTKLPNRYRLLQDIEALNDPQLILINIDDFKEINDFYGHKIGDNLLIEIAKKLKTLLQDDKFKVYKLHADEYSVLTKIQMKKEKLRELVIYLTTTITHKFFKISDNEITVNITIGIATGKRKILENADMALKFAKTKKKNYMFFDKSMLLFKEYENNLKWIKRLKKAITENKIIPFFQPIYNAKSNKIKEYECLARIINIKGEILLPDSFIDIAKKAKLCTYITRMMIKKSIEVFKNNNYSFSINLTVEDILNAYTIAYIKKLLKDYNIGHRIVFEILESESIQNYKEVSSFIKEMKKLGCRIAIDDFGAGYSNFQHILKLNVDYIKIDSSLIMNIHKDKNAQAIVESIVSFSKKLNIKTIAEFVYTKKVYNKVKSLHVDYLQGYYLGHPRPQL